MIYFLVTHPAPAVIATTGQTKEAPHSHWKVTMSEERNCGGVETPRDKEFIHGTHTHKIKRRVCGGVCVAGEGVCVCV